MIDRDYIKSPALGSLILLKKGDFNYGKKFKSVFESCTSGE